MELEDLLKKETTREFEINLGRDISKYVSDLRWHAGKTKENPIYALAFPVGAGLATSKLGAKTLGESGKFLTGNIYDTASRTISGLKENYSKGILKGTANTLEDVLKKGGKCAGKTADKAISLPGAASLAAISKTMSYYLKDIKEDMPFNMSVDSFIDGFALLPKTIGNLGYSAISNAHDLLTSTIGTITKPLINGDIDEMYEGFGKIYEEAQDISNIPIELIENISFAENISTVDGMSEGLGIASGALATAAVGKYAGKRIYDKIKNKGSNKKEDYNPKSHDTHILSQIGKATAMYSGILYLCGKTAELYTDKTFMVTAAGKVMSAGVTAANYIASGPVYLYKGLEYASKYFTGPGKADLAGLVAGDYARSATNFLEHIAPYSDDLIKMGTGIAFGGILYALSTAKDYLDTTSEKEIKKDYKMNKDFIHH